VTSVNDDGETSTAATGTRATFTVADVDFPSLVAVTVTGPPVAFARMLPIALFAANGATPATVESDDVHVTVRPLNTSFAISVSTT
jgi:hypothetical protein